MVENSLRDSGHEAERDSTSTLSLALMDNADRSNGPITSTELKRSEEKKSFNRSPSQQLLLTDAPLAADALTLH